jgi:hypothetical protein
VGFLSVAGRNRAATTGAYRDELVTARYFDRRASTRNIDEAKRTRLAAFSCQLIGRIGSPTVNVAGRFNRARMRPTCADRFELQVWSNLRRSRHENSWLSGLSVDIVAPAPEFF